MPDPVHPYYALASMCREYHATLVAVSKMRTISEIMELYQMGQRIFGENRAQELLEKAPHMASDIEWHLIGHLQTNKVRAVIPYVTCIQSLDSERLWDKIQEESSRAGKKTACLLQIKIAAEETKFGWSFEALQNVLQQGKHLHTTSIDLRGVMGMATLTDDADQVRREMRQLKTYFEILKQDFFPAQGSFDTISMGMSGDYKIALEEGSTMIRVGSLLFT